MPGVFRAQHQPTEFRHMQFCVEASDLRLPPGEFPPVLDTDLGNGLRFVLHHVENGGTHVYRQEGGCIALFVLND